MNVFFRLICGLLLLAVLGTFGAWRDPANSNNVKATDFMSSLQSKPEESADPATPVETPRPEDTRPVNPSSSQNNVFAEYDLSAPLESDLETAICTMLTEMTSEIDISSYELTKEDLKNTMAQIQYSHPEYFYVSSAYEFTVLESGVVKTLRPTYLYSQGLVSTMNRLYQERIAAIAAEIDPSWSDFDKALYLHDYFLRNYSYDYTYTVHDAYNFLDGKTGVCQAYMLAMIAVGEAVGLEVLPVTSEAMLHAWNLVKINGAWYHMDLTWDDSSANTAAVSYRYFLLSDNGLAATDQGEKNPHCEWTTFEKSSDTTYDEAYFHDARMPIVKTGDSYYCILSVEGNSKAQGAIFGGTDVRSLEALQLISSKWLTAEANSYYIGCFAGICVYNGKLVYNTANTLRVYDPATKQDKSIGMIQGLSGQSIYGIYGIKDAVITISVAADPNSSGKLVEVNLPQTL